LLGEGRELWTMPSARLVAVLLVVGNVAGRALQADDGEANDLGEFTFSTGAWLKDVRKANATKLESVAKPKASPSPKESVTKPTVVDTGSVAGASVCKSIRVGSSDAWCDGNCVMTPASSFCTLSCHCPGWNAKPEVTKAKSARNDIACISKDYQLSTDSWCNDNCVGFLGEGGESHDQECDETCECTAKLKAAADARMAKAEAKVAKVAKAEQAKASPAPKAAKGGVCKSISEEAPAAWCDKTCQADPNAAWCVKACRCPGFSEAKVKALCTSVSEGTPASWCQDTCADTPDTKQCALICHCPGWKAAHVQPLHAPQAASAPLPTQAPAPKGVKAPAPLPQPAPLKAPAPQPVVPAVKPQQSTKEVVFEKVCKRKVGSSVSADWCDRSCARTPGSVECKAVCDCPFKHVKEKKKAKAKCVSNNDLGLDDFEAAAQWCDLNCMNDPAAQWCSPCKCPTSPKAKLSAL
jgi:hypothetical protein